MQDKKNISFFDENKTTNVLKLSKTRTSNVHICMKLVNDIQHTNHNLFKLKSIQYA